MPLDTRTIIQEPSSGLWKQAQNPDVYVDIYGVTHAVWSAETAGVKRIFYIFDDGNLSFNTSDLTLVGNINRNSDNPRIGVNRSGRVVIVFELENSSANGKDVHCASNDGALSLTVSVDISRNSGPGIINNDPRIVIHDENKDPHFAWLQPHPISGKILPYYTKKNATTLIATTHLIAPEINNDCAHLEIALMGDKNKIFATFEQIDNSTSKKNIRLAQGDNTGFASLGQYVDSLSLPIINRPTLLTENLFPRIAATPRIADIIEPPTSDDDPDVLVVWEDSESPNHIKYTQRHQTDFSNGIIATSGVHRPNVAIGHTGLIVVTYYKSAGPNNVVNLSFKTTESNQWTEASDIASGHAFGDGIYNIEVLVSGDDRVYVSFKTGPAAGPQRVIHVNNFRTASLFSYEIFSQQLDSPSDTRSRVAMHIDDKRGNRLLASDADSRAAVIFTDFTEDFSQPDGIGDVHIFGGVIAPKPTLIAVTDADGDNKPEFTWFMPGEHSEGYFDFYFRLCGASGIVPYQENIMLSGTFVSGLSGIPEAGYVFTHEGPSGINLADIYGFGVRKREGPWSDEFCFRLGDISVSNPTIIPPNSKIKVEKCDVISIGGSAEPGSVIESQTLIEYSNENGTTEINRSIITAVTINAQGNYSGSLPLNLLPTTAAIRIEVIARDTDNNLSDPASSVSNLIVVQNIPPTLLTVVIRAQATGSTEATNSINVDVATTFDGDAFEIKIWESVTDGGTGEIGASWVPYQAITLFTFANNTDGTKTIFVRLRDACSNESGIISANIEFDTIPPQILAAVFDPGSRKFTITFSEPVSHIDLSKIRLVKA